jgi:hypothetical protein
LPQPNGRDVFALTSNSAELVPEFAVNDHRIPCKLDPTFRGGFLLPDSLARVLPIVSRPNEIGTMLIDNTAIALRETQLAANATVGMFEFPKPTIHFGETQGVCRVGGRNLMEFAVTYDVANGRVRLARSSSRDARSSVDEASRLGEALIPNR